MKRPEMNAFDPIEMRLGAKVERKVEKAKRPDRVIAPGVVECGETGKMRTEFPRWGCWEPKQVEKRLPKVRSRFQARPTSAATSDSSTPSPGKAPNGSSSNDPLR